MAPTSALWSVTSRPVVSERHWPDEPAQISSNATRTARMYPPGGWPCPTKQSQTTKTSKASLLTSPISQITDKIPCSLRRESWSSTPNLAGVFDASQWSNSLQIEKIPCKCPYSREFGPGDRFDQGCIHHHRPWQHFRPSSLSRRSRLPSWKRGRSAHITPMAQADSKEDIEGVKSPQCSGLLPSRWLC